MFRGINQKTCNDILDETVKKIQMQFISCVVLGESWLQFLRGTFGGSSSGWCLSLSIRLEFLLYKRDLSTQHPATSVLLIKCWVIDLLHKFSVANLWNCFICLDYTLPLQAAIILTRSTSLFTELLLLTLFLFKKEFATGIGEVFLFFYSYYYYFFSLLPCTSFTGTITGLLHRRLGPVMDSFHIIVSLNSEFPITSWCSSVWHSCSFQLSSSEIISSLVYLS